jgi:predicted N-formylglutamate amidohydrolase
MTGHDPKLLRADDPPAFCCERSAGASDYVLTADHASRRLPASLGDLGVASEALTTHIAWDVGIAEVARRVSERLDACLILQSYSRLVIDANRTPRTAQSIVTLSERTRVPGNQELTQSDIERREREIFFPYHQCIQEALDQRSARERPIALCSLHSFTPSFHGVARPWQIGVLYNRDARLGHALLELLREDPALVVGDNQPYAVSDETDYTVVVHAERRGIPYVEIEIRQDLITGEAGQVSWAERLADLLPRIYGRVFSRA